MTIATESSTIREFPRSRVAGRPRHINIHGANAKIMACKAQPVLAVPWSRFLVWTNCLQSSTRSSRDNRDAHDITHWQIPWPSPWRINETSLRCSVQSRVTRRAIDRGGSSVEGWWLANFPSSFRKHGWELLATALAKHHVSHHHLICSCITTHLLLLTYSLAPRLQIHTSKRLHLPTSARSLNLLVSTVAA